MNGKYFTALVNSGSSESYVNYNVCKKLNLGIYPSQWDVHMASSIMKVKSKGFCLADVTIKSVKYESTTLNIFENFWRDWDLIFKVSTVNLFLNSEVLNLN